MSDRKGRGNHLEPVCSIFQNQRLACDLLIYHLVGQTVCSDFVMVGSCKHRMISAVVHDLVGLEVRIRISAVRLLLGECEP